MAALHFAALVRPSNILLYWVLHIIASKCSCAFPYMLVNVCIMHWFCPVPFFRVKKGVHCFMRTACLIQCEADHSVFDSLAALTQTTVLVLHDRLK